MSIEESTDYVDILREVMIDDAIKSLEATHSLELLWILVIKRTHRKYKNRG